VRSTRRYVASNVNVSETATLPKRRALLAKKI
jgi:hypothetical protein